MIGLDASILVRYLTKDDPLQSPIASRVINALTPEEPGFISVVALVETVWVLSRRYPTTRPQIADTIETLLRARELVVESKNIAYLALATYRATNADFADALIMHGARFAGCSVVFTFDRRAAGATGMRLLTA